MSSAFDRGLTRNSVRPHQSPESEPPPMLDRIARFCVRRRGIVLIAWIGILVVTSVVANGIVKADYRADMKLPDSESRQVQDLSLIHI